MTKAPFQKMNRRQAAHGRVIRPNPGQTQILILVVEIDYRRFHASKTPRESRIRRTAKNAVPSAGCQPGRRRRPQFVLFEKHGPSMMGSQVTRDSHQKASSITHRGFDDECDLGRVSGRHFISRAEIDPALEIARKATFDSSVAVATGSLFLSPVPLSSPSPGSRFARAVRFVVETDLLTRSRAD